MKSHKMAVFGAAFTVGFALLMAVGFANAGQTFSMQTLFNQHVEHTFFTATTTSATSTASSVIPDRILNIAGADQVTFYFSRGGSTGPNTGSTKFEIEVSSDGSNWHNFNRMYLLDSSKTATSTVWITAATSTVIASMDLEMNAFRFVRCQAVEVTDGDHTCAASVEY